MLGSNPGWVVSQGEVLASLFAKDGHSVRTTSSRVGRLPRLLDSVHSLVKWRGKVDVAIVSIFSGPAFVLADVCTAISSRVLQLPIVLHLHGGNLPDFAAQRETWVRRVLERGDRLVAPSNYLADTFRSWGFTVDVIPNIIQVDPSLHRPRARIGPKVLWMRSFHDVYNPLMAVDAFEALRRLQPDATMTMAGQDKGLLEETKAAARSRSVSDAVRFVGFLDDQGKEREFASHDIFINTNRIDNAPVTTIEAAAFGLPMVMTRVGGITDLYKHEHTALLVEDGDAEGMAHSINRLLTDPELSLRLSLNGNEIAAASSWAAVGELWRETLHQVLSESSS